MAEPVAIHDAAHRCRCQPSALVASAAGVSSKRGTMMSDENLELRIAARLGELVNWTRRIFWLLLIVLVIEVILMAFLLLRYLAA